MFATSIEPDQPARPYSLTKLYLLVEHLQVHILISLNMIKVEGGLFHLRNSVGLMVKNGQSYVIHVEEKRIPYLPCCPPYLFNNLNIKFQRKNILLKAVLTCQQNMQLNPHRMFRKRREKLRKLTVRNLHIVAALGKCINDIYIYSFTWKIKCIQKLHVLMNKVALKIFNMVT